MESPVSARSARPIDPAQRIPSYENPAASIRTRAGHQIDHRRRHGLACRRRAPPRVVELHPLPPLAEGRLPPHPNHWVTFSTAVHRRTLAWSTRHCGSEGVGRCFSPWIRAVNDGRLFHIGRTRAVRIQGLVVRSFCPPGLGGRDRLDRRLRRCRDALHPGSSVQNVADRFEATPGESERGPRVRPPSSRNPRTGLHIPHVERARPVVSAPNRPAQIGTARSPSERAADRLRRSGRRRCPAVRGRFRLYRAISPWCSRSAAGHYSPD